MKKKDYIFYKKRYWQYILICDEDGYRPSEYPSFQCYVKGIETLLNLLKLKQFLE